MPEHSPAVQALLDDPMGNDTMQLLTDEILEELHAIDARNDLACEVEEDLYEFYNVDSIADDDGSHEREVLAEAIVRLRGEITRLTVPLPTGAA